MFLERFYVDYYVVAAFSYKKLSTFALRLIHSENKRESQELPVAFYSDFNMTHGDLYSVKYISVLNCVVLSGLERERERERERETERERERKLPH